MLIANGSDAYATNSTSTTSSADVSSHDEASPRTANESRPAEVNPIDYVRLGIEQLHGVRDGWHGSSGPNETNDQSAIKITLASVPLCRNFTAPDVA